jgi:hypothetical protein
MIALDAAAHGGKGSATLGRSDANAAGVLAVFQSIRADRFRGRRIRLSAFLRTKDVSDGENHGAGIAIAVRGPKETLVEAGVAPATRRVRGTTDWIRYEHVVDVPAEAVLLEFGAVLGGRGQAWADDFKLEVVDKSVTTTSDINPREMRPAEQERIQQTLRTAPELPVNLDFES